MFIEPLRKLLNGQHQNSDEDFTIIVRYKHETTMF